MYEIKSSAKVFDQHRVFHYTLAGRPLVVETGKLAGLANGVVTAEESPWEGVLVQTFHLDLAQTNEKYVYQDALKARYVRLSVPNADVNTKPQNCHLLILLPIQSPSKQYYGINICLFGGLYYIGGICFDDFSEAARCGRRTLQWA